MIDENLDPKVSAVMKDIMSLMRKHIPEQFGITLMIFDYGDKGRMNYISTAVREDMIAAMKECIAKLEGRFVENKASR